MDIKDANGFINKSINGSEATKVEEEEEEEEEEDQIDDEESETNPLLPPKKDEMSRKSDRKRLKLKVQWNDRHGNQLAEVLEFVPSDVSDTEEDDSDACICEIM